MDFMRILPYLLQLYFLIAATTLIDAGLRPLFMARNHKTQTRYSIFLLVGLLTIALLQWFRVASMLSALELWPESFRRAFAAYALRLYGFLAAANLLAFALPGVFPLVFPVLPLPRGRLLALNRPRRFWAQRTLLQLSGEKLLHEGRVCIAATDDRGAERETVAELRIPGSRRNSNKRDSNGSQIGDSIKADEMDWQYEDVVDLSAR